MSDWKNNIQKELLKNLVDQLYALEAENEKLKKNGNNGNPPAASTALVDEEEELRKIKLKVFGPDLDKEER